MMTDNPTTPDEWQAYIGVLTGADLVSKAMAANSILFVRQLEREGVTAEDIEHVLILFGQRLEADGQIAVGGDYIDYADLLAPVTGPPPA